jgi:NAD(P)-dependent dehydrogenase (short-subunit alcohol dehydrogenase family)
VFDINVGGISETTRLTQQVKKIDVLEIEVNVADEQSLIESIQRVVNHFGRIDIVVNNAAIVDPLLPSTKSLTTDFRRVIDTNLTGLWMCQREAIKQMLKQELIEQR